MSKNYTLQLKRKKKAPKKFFVFLKAQSSGVNVKLNFSEWLEQELKKRNWSIRELSRRCSISHSSIATMIRGKEPSWDFCASIAPALNYSKLEIFLIAEKLSVDEIASFLPTIPPELLSNKDQLISLIGELSEKEKNTLFYPKKKLAPSLPSKPSPPSSPSQDPLIEEVLKNLNDLNDLNDLSNKLLNDFLIKNKEKSSLIQKLNNHITSTSTE